MSLIYDNRIKYQDTANLDAFGRLRTSEPVLLLDIKRVGGTPENYAVNEVTGTGSAIYDINQAGTRLIVGEGTGSAIRRSRARAVYQPGKSLQGLITFQMDPSDDCVQRVGYFDAENGVFLEKNSDGIFAVLRRNSIDTKIPQDNWSEDRLNGRGPSEITLDILKSQILMIDMEWLGAGRVRMFSVVNGQYIPFHFFKHANEGIGTYMSNPNLTLRWEITGSPSAARSMLSICGSASSEGGYEITGITSGADNGIVGRPVDAGATVELLAIRIKDIYKKYSTGFGKELSIVNNTNGAFRWRLLLNPTATTAGTWSDVSTAGSVMEQNTTRNIIADTGFVLNPGYVSGNVSAVEIEAKPVLTLGTSAGGEQDILSLVVTNLTNQTDTYFASLGWREVY